MNFSESDKFQWLQSYYIALNVKLPCICIEAHISCNVFITVYFSAIFCSEHGIWFAMCCQKSVWPLNRFNKIFPSSLMTAANWQYQFKANDRQTDTRISAKSIHLKNIKSNGIRIRTVERERGREIKKKKKKNGINSKT